MPSVQIVFNVVDKFRKYETKTSLHWLDRCPGARKP